MHGGFSLKASNFSLLKMFFLPVPLLAILFFLAFFSLPSSHFVSADPLSDSKRVLLLHSYHHGNKWTDDETEGIRLALGYNRPGLQLSIEYMDTKRLASPDYFTQLTQIYASKFGNSHFDVIIAADDNAFFFLREHRDQLFPGTPVVFCGVNYFEDSYLHGIKGFTGVNEEADLKGAIDIALQLHPDTEQMVLITDATETGHRISLRFNEIIPLYKDKVNFQILADHDMEEIEEEVGKLGKGSLVLFTFFFKDRKGEFFEYYQSTEMITGKSKVPVYGAWDYSLGHGIVGGLLASGVDQGKVAGEIALRILDGEPVDTIPVVQKSPNRYYFDYRQLRRFDIQEEDLPKGSIVNNAPALFYEINKRMVWTVIGVSSALIVLVVFLLVNVVKRRKAEQAFVASEKNFHTLVDNLRVGVFRSSSDVWHGNYLQVNQAMLSIFGFDTLEEIQRVPIASLYQRSEERESLVLEIIERGYVKDRELAMRKKDGTPISVNCSAAVQYNDKGAIQWLDGVMEDVTQRKNLEEQFRHAQKMEAVGTLAGGIAHDFNNLLTALIGYAELGAAIEDDNKKRAGYFKQILSCSKKAASLTHSLLAFSRKQVMKPKLADLNHTVNRIETLLQRLLGDEIEVQTSYYEKPLVIFADHNQLEQVLMNLATNARDAMPKGGKLSITTNLFMMVEKHESEQDGNLQPGPYALISVSDTGVGINKDLKHKIFEPFFTTKEFGKGTGLGLSTVYGIIKQHDGDVEVRSQENNGTVFNIYFPLHEGKPVESTSSASTEQHQGGSETILLAEDNEDVKSLLIQILSNSGYQVIPASNGEEAVELFHRHKEDIDMVLTDMMMPKLNGKEMAEEIHKRDSSVKILYMSGNTSGSLAKAMSENEDMTFLQKPMSPALLLTSIRDILDG